MLRGRIRIPPFKDWRSRRGLVFLSLLVVVIFVFYYQIDRYVRNVPSTGQLSIARAEAMVKGSPGDPGLRVQLAEVYVAQRRYDEAARQYQAAITLEPGSPGPYLGLGNVYYAQDKYPQAQEAYLKVTEFYKDKPERRSLRPLNELHYNLAIIYEKEGKLEEAAASLQEALAIDRVDADALYRLGVVKLRQGRPEEAARACEEAVRYAPDFREAYETLVAAYGQLGREDLQLYARGMVRYSQKDYRGAVSSLEKAVQALPDHEMARVGLGMAYEKSGQQAQALAAYQEAGRLNPESLAVKWALQRLASP